VETTVFTPPKTLCFEALLEPLHHVKKLGRDNRLSGFTKGNKNHKKALSTDHMWGIIIPSALNRFNDGPVFIKALVKPV
jgi:hypothetical protein